MILVTGHRGFIGQRLCQELRDKGHEFVGYDLVSGDDIRDYFKLSNVFEKEGVDIVIHLAARAGVRTGEEFPEEFITTNIIGTQNLLKLAKKFNCKHFVFFSSSSVYGSEPSPNKEDDRLAPESLYGITKQTGEELVKASGLRSTIIRPFTVYGENGRKDQVMFKWINQINVGKPITFYGDGKTKRGYTYVGDLVDGVINELGRKRDKERPPCEIFNLGGEEVFSLEELLNIFKDTKPDIKVRRLPLPKGDVPENWGDISKAKREIGFNPNSSFYENVKRIISKEIK